MPAIGRTAKTQSQNLRQYKRIAIAAGLDRGKTGNGIAQPTFGAPGGRALTKLVTAWALAPESGAGSRSGRWSGCRCRTRSRRGSWGRCWRASPWQLV